MGFEMKVGEVCRRVVHYCGKGAPRAGGREDGFLETYGAM